jgi:hypothetical protein
MHRSRLVGGFVFVFAIVFAIRSGENWGKVGKTRLWRRMKQDDLAAFFLWPTDGVLSPLVCRNFQEENKTFCFVQRRRYDDLGGNLPRHPARLGNCGLCRQPGGRWWVGRCDCGFGVWFYSASNLGLFRADSESQEQIGQQGVLGIIHGNAHNPSSGSPCCKSEQRHEKEVTNVAGVSVPEDVVAGDTWMRAGLPKFPLDARSSF